MTKLTTKQLKAKISDRLNSANIPIEADKCLEVFEKAREGKHEPETEQSRWLLKQMRRAGIVRKTFVEYFDMEPGFDESEDETT